MAELTPSPMPLTPLDRELGLKLALCGVFDPLGIPELVEDYAMRAEVARVSVEQAYADRWLWTLRPEARVVFLGHFPPPGSARKALLAANVSWPDDWLAQAMRRLLAPHPDAGLRAILAGQPNVDSPTDALLALFQAMQWLQQAQVSMPAWGRRARVLERLKEAVEYSRQHHEQATLLTCADQNDADGRLHAMQEFACAREPCARSAAVDDAWPHTLHGKLHLLLVTDSHRPRLSVPLALLHRRLQTEAQADTLCIWLDLERSALRGGEPRAMTHEMLRQLARYAPAMATALAAIRAQLREADPMDPGANAQAFSAMQVLLPQLKIRTVVVLVHAWHEALAQGHEHDFGAWLLDVTVNGRMDLN